MSCLQKTLFSQESTILVHPLASLGALSHYTRPHQTKTIGLLLATKSNEVVNSIPLKSIKRENDYWVDEAHFQKQWDILNTKVIGWYLVDMQSEITDNEVELHHYFENEFATNLIFICFDVTAIKRQGLQHPNSTVKQPIMQMKAYRKTHLSFGEKVLADKFEVVSVKHEATSQERVALRSVLKKSNSFSSSLRELQNNIKEILQYLNTGSDSPNYSRVCQEVQEAFNELPAVHSAAFKAVFETCAQDIRMAGYLATIIQEDTFHKFHRPHQHHQHHRQHYNRDQNRDQNRENSHEQKQDQSA